MVNWDSSLNCLSNQSQEVLWNLHYTVLLVFPLSYVSFLFFLLCFHMYIGKNNPANKVQIKVTPSILMNLLMYIVSHTCGTIPPLVFGFLVLLPILPLYKVLIPSCSYLKLDRKQRWAETTSVVWIDNTNHLIYSFIWPYLFCETISQLQVSIKVFVFESVLCL